MNTTDNQTAYEQVWRKAKEQFSDKYFVVGLSCHRIEDNKTQELIGCAIEVTFRGRYGYTGDSINSMAKDLNAARWTLKTDCEGDLEFTFHVYFTARCESLNIKRPISF